MRRNARRLSRSLSISYHAALAAVEAIGLLLVHPDWRYDGVRLSGCDWQEAEWIGIYETPDGDARIEQTLSFATEETRRDLSQPTMEAALTRAATLEDVFGVHLTDVWPQPVAAAALLDAERDDERAEVELGAAELHRDRGGTPTGPPQRDDHRDRGDDTEIGPPEGGGPDRWPPHTY